MNGVICLKLQTTEGIMANNMTNKQIAEILKSILESSSSAPPGTPVYKGDCLADKLSVLIQVLKLEVK